VTDRRDNPLPYGRQWIEQADIDAVTEVLADPWITQGPRVDAFEGAVAAWCGVKHGVAVSSGTAALHSACMAAGLGEGDSVVVPTMTFAATAAAARLTGAEIQLADIDPETLCLSADSADAACDGTTRALLPVDFAGRPCAWTQLRSLAGAKGLITIADAAHALGAMYSGAKVGALADMTCFSFHPVKAITTAEGGMTVTVNDEYADALRRARNHGIVRERERFESPGGDAESDGDWYYEIQSVGLNYRITDIQCALGLSQLGRLEAFIRRRTELAEIYSLAFAGNELLATPQHGGGDKTSAWHIYPIRLNLDGLSWSRAEVFAALRDKGLGVQVHYIPLHRQPYYRNRYGLSPADFPHAEAYYRSAISLPLFPAMTDRDAEDVVDLVTDVLAEARR
jgi:perosamine synthetase